MNYDFSESRVCTVRDMYHTISNNIFIDHYYRCLGCCYGMLFTKKGGLFRIIRGDNFDVSCTNKGRLGKRLRTCEREILERDGHTFCNLSSPEICYRCVKQWGCLHHYWAGRGR